MGGSLGLRLAWRKRNVKTRLQRESERGSGRGKTGSYTSVAVPTGEKNDLAVYRRLKFNPSLKVAPKRREMWKKKKP